MQGPETSGDQHVEGITVLLVDDDPAVLDLTATFLEREERDFETRRETDPEAVVEDLGDVDCVVSDFEMPGMTGLELLEAIRRTRPNLPFILFTGKGSEEVASDAISAGVTDYLRKGGPERYAVLANRVSNAVARRRAERDRDRRIQAMDALREGVAMFDASGTYGYVNSAYAALYDRDPAWFDGRSYDVVNTPEEVDRMREVILPSARRTGVWRGTAVGRRADGSTFPKAKSVTPLDDGGFVCVVSDVSGGADVEAGRNVGGR